MRNMFFLDRCFLFGKYDGLTLKQVYQGTNCISTDLLKSYVNYVLNNEEEDFFQKNIPLNRLMSFEVSEGQIQIKPFRNSVKGDFNKRIEQIFALRNDPADRTYIDSLDEFNVKTYSLNKRPVELIGGNPEYITWCLNKIDGFYIHSMEELFALEIYRFRGFKVSLVKENLYNYEPIIIIENRNLSQALIDFNLYKQQSSSFKNNNADYSTRNDDSKRDYFDAMTGGQLGSYDDFNGSIDDISDWAGR